MIHAFRTFFLAIAATLAVTSCMEKEQDSINVDTQGNIVCLKISSVTTTDLTKSVVRGTSFPADEDVSIGIFVRETEGTGSYGDITYKWPYENVKCTRAAGQTEWVMSEDIKLDATSVIVYAYYPWKEGTISDHIDVYPSVNGDDWMWATPIENVSSANPDIKLTMNHALAMVEMTFNVTNYSEGTVMKDLSVSSPGAARYSSFNFKSGVHFPFGKMIENNALSANVNYPIKDGVIKADFLLVPAGTSSSRQDMTVSCTLVDKTYTANLSGANGIIIQQGVKSTVSLNIKGSTMEVVSVGISGWDGNIDGTSATVDGHSVTVSGEVPAILSLTGVTSLSSDDDEPVSEILAISYDKSVLNDGVFELVYSVKPSSCRIDHNAESGVLTVSDVTDDIDITLDMKVVKWDEVPVTDGTYTVNGSGKKVRFSIGNLYWNGVSFEIEPDQLSFSGSWNSSHVSHFYWSNDAAVSYQQRYNDPQSSADDVFFTNATETAANPAFIAGGLKNFWRCLSDAEWNYLINTRVVNGGTGEGHTCVKTSINGRSGLLIFCDSYAGGIEDITSIPEGCAFLPVSGYRSDDIRIDGPSSYGYCWSSSAVDYAQAYCVSFREGVKTSVNNYRKYGFPVRLVVDVKE